MQKGHLTWLRYNHDMLAPLHRGCKVNAAISCYLTLWHTYCFCMQGLIPLLSIDVWEHAYVSGCFLVFLRLCAAAETRLAWHAALRRGGRRVCCIPMWALSFKW